MCELIQTNLKNTPSKSKIITPTKMNFLEYTASRNDVRTNKLKEKYEDIKSTILQFYVNLIFSFLFLKTNETSIYFQNYSRNHPKLPNLLIKFGISSKLQMILKFSFSTEIQIKQDTKEQIFISVVEWIKSV